MTDRQGADRRTVLKSIPAIAIGGSLATGTANANRTGTHSAVHAQTENQNTIEIVAKHDHEADEHLFEFSTTEVPSGWVTITLDNQTPHTHFVSLYKFPQAAIDAADKAGEDLLDYYHEHVVRPFQYLMDDIVPDKKPNPDDLSDKYSKPEEDSLFPPWSADSIPSSGVGLTAGHRSATTTIELTPGKYYTECYVKDDDEEFHSYNGMADMVTVTDDRAGTPPDPTVEVSLSTVETNPDKGLRSSISIDKTPQAGQHTVAVRFKDQHFQGPGHDAHLIRLDADTTLDDVNGWMDWQKPGQLIADGTEPGTFLGGVHDYATPKLLERVKQDGGTSGEAPKSAYFDVTLNPGAYALVSEVPQPKQKGLLETFSIPFSK